MSERNTGVENTLNCKDRETPGKKSGPNYIAIINWTWETLPETPGCKASHLSLFLAIVDSINKNRWRETYIPYVHLINKCKISKQVYLDARAWLLEHDFLDIQIGKNGYQMASFKLGKAVKKQTATITATDTSTGLIPVEKQTAGVTHYINNKTVNNKTDSLFDSKEEKTERAFKQMGL